MQRGFTLVEMSIVIAIIGLIVGGVVVGQSLIRAAQLNSVGADVARTRQAVKLFRDQYKYLPGDMANAATVWGALSASCTTDAASGATGTATCNGNGDGRIGNMTVISVPATGYEVPRVWQHLSNAGMVEGAFTGGLTVSGQAISGRIGVNYPKVRFDEATMAVVSQTITSTGDSSLFPFVGEAIMYGRHIPNASTTSGWPLFPLLTASEAESLDIKLDDGKPGTGRAWTLKSTSSIQPNCASSGDADTAEYNVLTYGKIRVCGMLFDLNTAED